MSRNMAVEAMTVATTRKRGVEDPQGELRRHSLCVRHHGHP